jgi:hypothetical protein
MKKEIKSLYKNFFFFKFYLLLVQIEQKTIQTKQLS